MRMVDLNEKQIETLCKIFDVDSIYEYKKTEDKPYRSIRTYIEIVLYGKCEKKQS